MHAALPDNNSGDLGISLRLQLVVLYMGHVVNTVSIGIYGVFSRELMPSTTHKAQITEVMLREFKLKILTQLGEQCCVAVCDPTSCFGHGYFQRQTTVVKVTDNRIQLIL